MILHFLAQALPVVTSVLLQVVQLPIYIAWNSTPVCNISCKLYDSNASNPYMHVFAVDAMCDSLASTADTI